MTDKEVGVFWRWLKGTTYNSPLENKAILLIRKLVEERTSLLFNKHVRDTFRPSRFRRGKKEPNPYYAWTVVEYAKMAREQFGILEEDWQ